jgi:hypothetical protein
MSWTAEQIYLKPNSGGRMPPVYPHHMMRNSSIYTPKFLAVADSEKQWVEQSHRRLFTKQEFTRFADEPDHECPMCGNSRQQLIPVKGATTGIYVLKPAWCNCAFVGLFWRHWRKVPLRYRDVRLASTQPSTLVNMPLPKQAAIQKIIKENWEKSMLLEGAAKTGKTHLMMGLYRAALEGRIPNYVNYKPGAVFGVWRVNTSVWLEELVRDSMAGRDEDLPIPELTERKVTQTAQAGFKPKLFLEEIDKFKPSEFKLIRLFEIVNSVYEAGGQVVATSNTPAAQLATEWGARYGETTLRRIGDGPDGMMVLFS